MLFLHHLDQLSTPNAELCILVNRNDASKPDSHSYESRFMGLAVGTAQAERIDNGVVG